MVRVLGQRGLAGGGRDSVQEIHTFCNCSILSLNLHASGSCIVLHTPTGNTEERHRVQVSQESLLRLKICWPVSKLEARL